MKNKNGIKMQNEIQQLRATSKIAEEKCKIFEADKNRVEATL
jgi:hypothetical protein